MPEELPDDVRGWPTDPFRLLGVDRTAPEAELKRAYTRLIRRFKPEHFPEQFRRVREAYEAALDQLKWFRFFPSPEPFVTHAAGPQPESPAPAVRDPDAEAWALAGSEPAAAYAHFVEQNRVRPENAEV